MLDWTHSVFRGHTVPFAPTAGTKCLSRLRLSLIHILINSNGASGWDRVENRVIYSNPIPAETVRQILRILEPYGLLTQIYCGGNIYAEKRSLARVVDLPFAVEFIENIRKTQIELDSFQTLLEEHPEGVEKLNLAHVESGLREKLWKQFEAMPGVTVVSSAGSNIELNRDRCV